LDHVIAEELVWVVLTTGRRPAALERAVASLGSAGAPADVTILSNGGEPVKEDSFKYLRSEQNLGVPGGRDFAFKAVGGDLVGFLDDDAELRGDLQRIVDEFAADPELGAVALRLVDEHGETSRRHVPRAGHSDPALSGEVTYFLGGACVLRRQAYEQVGGYFVELFYGHEEIELSWRLIDAGWRIRYLADVEVFHPRTEISRHADGWALTGRNRVWIARRSLPWPVAISHVVFWLFLGTVRAPKGECRRSYLRGWRSGWTAPIQHRPISWAAVWKLTRLGRPPII